MSNNKMGIQELGQWDGNLGELFLESKNNKNRII